MKKSCLWFFLAFFAILGFSANALPASEEILKSVVKIRALVPEDARTARTLGTERTGNGVVIDTQGHILTIGYLITEAETIEVFGPEGKTVKAVFAGYDHSTGFGLIKATQPLKVKPIPLGHSSKIEEGDTVLVAGYGGTESAQGARIIAKKEFAASWEYLLDEALFTAPSFANFGGAALIGRDGTLLGVGSLYTQVVVQGVGVIPCNMFVPIDLLSPILEDLKKTGRSSQAPHPWMGISGEEAHGRVFVGQVTPDAPAEKAGLQKGDIILKVKGQTVSGLADFYRKVWALGKPGVEIPLNILQGTEIRDMTIHSSDRYQFLRLKPKKLI